MPRLDVEIAAPTMIRFSKEADKYFRKEAIRRGVKIAQVVREFTDKKLTDLKRRHGGKLPKTTQ